MYYVSRTERDIGHALRVLRDSTTVFTQDSDYNSGYIYTGGSGGLDVGLGAAAALNYLDSPNTTSAITYKTQGKANTTTNNGRVTYQEGSPFSTILLLEIGA